MAKKNNALRIVLIVVAVILVGAIGSGVWLIAYVSNPKNAFSELEETRKVDLVATPEPTPEPTATPEQTDEALTPEPRMGPAMGPTSPGMVMKLNTRTNSSRW